MGSHRGGVVTGMVVAGVVVLVVGWAALTYNRLVRLRNRSQEAWSAIDVQLQRRADLVPELVRTVRGYADHERGVLDAVTAARARMAAAAGPRDAGAADDSLEAALGRLFAVAEGYPELRASGNYLELQRELSRLEEDISFARRYYNATAEDLNTAIQSVPTVLLARPLGFVEREYFKADADAVGVPSVARG